MCFEWKNRFNCGHIGFKKVERCASLGTGCFGPDGTEKFVNVDGLCYDCRARLLDPIPMTRENDPWKKGGGAQGSGQGSVAGSSTRSTASPQAHPWP
jgi:xeroderma pigmentosum group C-complementing protein